MKMGKAFDAATWSRHNALWKSFQDAIAKDGVASKQYFDKPSETTAKTSLAAYKARCAAEKAYDEFMRPYRATE